MYEETPKQEKIEIDKNNKILFISNKTIKNPKESNTINSKYTTNDYTQKQNIDKLNSNKDNENENQNINDKKKKKISLNKEQLYETFLLFQNYLSSNKNNFEIKMKYLHLILIMKKKIKKSFLNFNSIINKINPKALLKIFLIISRI